MGASQSTELNGGAPGANAVSRVRQRLSEAGANVENVTAAEIDLSLAPLFRIPVNAVRYDIWGAFLTLASSFAISERELAAIFETAR